MAAGVRRGIWNSSPTRRGSAAAPELILQARKRAKSSEKLAPGDSWNWSNNRGRGGRGRGSNLTDSQAEPKGKGKKGGKGKGKNNPLEQLGRQGRRQQDQGETARIDIEAWKASWYIRLLWLKPWEEAKSCQVEVASRQWACLKKASVSARLTDKPVVWLLGG